MITSNSNYLVLSCDGGGIRGLLTALLLQDLSKEFDNFLDSINLFAGTSTGGIIALGLASGVQPFQLVEIYQKPEEIFTKMTLEDLNWLQKLRIFLYLISKFSKFFQDNYPQITDAMVKELDDSLKYGQENYISSDIKDLIEKIINIFQESVLPKYTNAGLKKVLNRYFTKPLDIVRPVVVTTFQLKNQGSWQPLTITNLHNDNTNDKDITLQADPCTTLQAALCTSAAPTFFPPYQHSKFGYCIDGGLFANNPSIVAFSYLIDLGFNPGNIKILSLGTGSFKSFLDIDTPELSGPLEWFLPVNPDSHTPNATLISLLMDGSSLLTETQFSILPRHNCKRVNVPLGENISLDDVAKVKEIEEYAKQYIESSEWKAVKDWVRVNYLS